jgi:hypothetical protein
MESVAMGNSMLDPEVFGRLWKADEEDRRESKESGRQAGLAWAEKEARPRQLRALGRLAFDDPNCGLEVQLGSMEHKGNSGIATGLFKVMRPKDKSDDRDIAAFWKAVLGDDGMVLIRDRDFALGFVEGALEILELYSYSD